MTLGYGFFCGGDPRNFFPDADCSEAEHAAHREACQRWKDAEDTGQPSPDQPCESGWSKLGDEDFLHVTKSSFGIGAYLIPDDEPEVVQP